MRLVGRSARSKGFSGNLLPQLAAAAAKLRAMPDGQFIDVRGKVPLTASLAIGFSFPEAAGFRLRAEQLSGGSPRLWSTMALPSDVRFVVASQQGGPGARMLIAIEVSAPVGDDLNEFAVKASPSFDSVTCLRPTAGCGETAIPDWTADARTLDSLRAWRAAP